MLLAGWWGLVAGLALLLGAVLGLYARASVRTIGLVMGFGAGVLMSAVAFELTSESFEGAGHLATITGLAAGALTFFVGDWLIDALGRSSPQEPHDADARVRRGSVGARAGRDARRHPGVGGGLMLVAGFTPAFVLSHATAHQPRVG